MLVSMWLEGASWSIRVGGDEWGRSGGGDARGERDEAWQRRKEAMARLRALDFTYHEKNLYAMNNNGGRNFALAHGRSLGHAQWILPLDGNCFFTPSAMGALSYTLSLPASNPQPAHVIIPMSRLLSNSFALLNNTQFPSTLDDALSLAPPAPDEPQIGFRWDSDEWYSEEMRYGRRSKLELLWRLGAIGKARDLGKRVHTWEGGEKKLLTEDAWGSIRTKDDEGEDVGKGYMEAGWVLRLFSGDQSQEEFSPAATTRRSINRIKGIVAFLEILDEGVARGIDVCEDDDNCGFAAWRTWSFDGGELERLKDEGGARVDELDDAAMRLVKELGPRLERGGWSSHGDDAAWAAEAAAVLALAGYLTSNHQYSTTSAQLIYARFLRPVANEATRYDFDLQYQGGDVAGDGVGYAFPIPRHGLTPSWLLKSSMRRKLPFDPETFDPTLLLDAIRLLSEDWRPQAHAGGSGHHHDHDRTEFPELPHRELEELFTAQLSFLLLHPAGQNQCAHPRTASDGAHYDLKVAALAAFINDAQVLGRIANRSRLRLPVEGTEGANGDGDGDGDVDKAKVLHARLMKGLEHVKLRPFDDVEIVKRSLGKGLGNVLEKVELASEGGGVTLARLLGER